MNNIDNTNKENFKSIATLTKKVTTAINYANTYTTINDNNSSKAIEDLQELVTKLEAQEEKFYKILQVNGIDDLNNRINSSFPKINELNAGGTIIQELKDQYDIGTNDQGKNYNDQIRNILEQTINDRIEDAIKIVGIDQAKTETELLAKALTFLTYIFNKELNKTENLYLFSGPHNNNYEPDLYKGSLNMVAKSAGILLGEGQTVVRFNGKGIRKINLFEHSVKGELKADTLGAELIKKDNNILTFHFTGDFPQLGSEMTSRLREMLYDDFKTISTNIRTPFPINLDMQRDIVNNIIKSKLGVTDQDLAFTKKIAISATDAGLAGYLGEIQNVLALRKVFPGLVNQTNGTGITAAGTETFSIAEGISGQDAPIDTLIKIVNNSQEMQEFGIQVKNVQGVSYAWNNESIGAESFLKGRVQDSSDELLDFFGAVTFFNIIDKKKVTHKENWDIYQSAYNEQIANIFGPLDKNEYIATTTSPLNLFFDAHIADIIRLQTIFYEDSKTGLFTKGKHYNNFYVFRNKFVPASVLVSSIISGIGRGRNAKQMFTSSYTLNPGQSHYPEKFDDNTSFSAYANETKMSFSARFKFSAYTG